MSSHHVVNDGQEPALIIANGEACSAELSGQLLEWNPLIIVLDGAVKRVLEMGIKFDVLLGDFDRLENLEEIKASQHPLEVVHAPDQNYTDLEKAIQYLIEKKQHAANIIWATGKRADHTVNNMMSLLKYKDAIRLVMLDDYSRIFPLARHFRKKYAPGTPVSLIPFGLVKGITTQGLKYNLENESLESSSRTGPCNEAIPGEWVDVRFEDGHLLLMECADGPD
jgi:thiamine pyrophosphokinase